MHAFTSLSIFLNENLTKSAQGYRYIPFISSAYYSWMVIVLQETKNFTQATLHLSSKYKKDKLLPVIFHSYKTNTLCCYTNNVINNLTKILTNGGT